MYDARPLVDHLVEYKEQGCESLRFVRRCLHRTRILLLVATHGKQTSRLFTLMRVVVHHWVALLVLLVLLLRYRFQVAALGRVGA